jgi:7-cyano-7-deazaguanine reductase
MATETSPLGRAVAYPRRYDRSLLHPIARATGRVTLRIGEHPLPFIGSDRWHAYELGWLDSRGRPVARTATFVVPCDSPCLVESKSLKLYLNSLNGEGFAGDEEVRARIAADLTHAAGADVQVAFGLPPVTEDATESIDHSDVDVDAYAEPEPGFLESRDGDVVEEVLHSALLKSNCPVTGQPDWASLRLAYRGPRIDRGGLLRYLASFREHAEFHEQCVERIFVDVSTRCRPEALSVEARYTRRGGLDINPWRATPGTPAPAPGRDPRQ